MFIKSSVLLIFLIISFTVVNAQKSSIGAEFSIVNGLATYLPKPDYPQEAKDFCSSGIVSVKVEIDEKGDVASAEMVVGDEFLHESAIEAAKKAKFRITRNNRVAIKVKGIIVYSFQSEQKCIVGGIVNKKAISLPKPYINPDVKIKQEVSVKVGVIIDEGGKVVFAKTLTNVHPLLRASFEAAARQAKFYPTNDVGRIRVKAYIVYKLKLNGKVET